MRKSLEYENEDELYEFYELVGEGSFSRVYRALFKPTEEIMAVKVIREEKDSDQLRELMKQEADLLNSLHHPHIIHVRHLI